MDYTYFIAIGLLAGLLQGLFSGGGLLMVPALVYLQSYLNMTPSNIAHVSIATSLACITVSGAAIAFFNHQKEAIRWDYFGKMVVGVIFGALVGAFFASSVSGKVLLYVIALHALAGGIYILYTKQKTEDDIHNPILDHVVAVAAGFISALAGIAGATVLVPYFLHKGIDVVHSLATSIALGVIITGIAAVNYGIWGSMSRNMPDDFFGFIWLPAVGVISASSIVSGYLGTRFIHGKAKYYMRKAFGLFALLMSFLVAFKIFGM